MVLSGKNEVCVHDLNIFVTIQLILNILTPKFNFNYVSCLNRETVLKFVMAVNTGHNCMSQ